MGTVLYQWSTVAQFVTVLMIALFYASLARSVKRAEVAYWAAGWWSNCAALAVAVSYWLFTPPEAVGPLLRALYVGGKAGAALLLVQGAMAMREPGAEWMSRRAIAGCTLAAAIAGTLFLSTLDRIGVGVQGTLGVLFMLCAIKLLRTRTTTVWLGVGFLLRSVFALVEAVAYYADSLPSGVLTPEYAVFVPILLGAHSSVDLAGEWLLALGGVLEITRRNQAELQLTNDDLLVAQDELRRLADRDPLTGLSNRRALPNSFRRAYDTGAVIGFFDLDAFKAINDRYGHVIGDASLVRFGAALTSSFRPGDTIIRYAGDEFVVVAYGMSVAMAGDRIAQLRERLRADGSVALEFAVGVTLLEQGADADAALRAADQAMYSAKKMPPGGQGDKRMFQSVSEPIPMV